MIEGRLTRREEIGKRLAILSFECAEPLQGFEPGRFVEVAATIPIEGSAIPGKQGDRRFIQRSYSLMNGESEGVACPEILVSRIEHGAFTPHLWSLSLDDTVAFDHCCRGRFSFGGMAPNAEILMVATGSGIAPFVSFLRSPNLYGTCHHIDLVHSVRTRQEVLDLENLCRGLPGIVRYIPIATRDPLAHQLYGHVRELLHDNGGLLDKFLDLPLASRYLYLCGNPQMIQEWIDVLRGRDIFNPRNAEHRLHFRFEGYW